MGIFNSLEFGGVNSLNHDVYITGEGVYNMPERDIESVEIPGRNGDFLLDKGRWKNIDVTYHCGTFGDDQTEFGSKMRAFRNQLASRYGYQRIVDTYYPDEFRLGVFKNTVEVDAVAYKRAGEFDVTFNCKPQRYLLSGESAVDMDSGESLYNPTPFDASPLLEVEGYGAVGFNGYEIELDNATMGDITIANSKSTTSPLGYALFETGLLNAGDTIRLSGVEVIGRLQGDTSTISVNSITNSNTDFFSVEASLNLTIGCDLITFTAGTARTVTNTTVANVTNQGTAKTITVTTTVQYIPEYNSSTKDLIQVNVSYTYDSGVFYSYKRLGWSGATATSSVSILGNPTYIDCEIGECYMIKDGSAISLNSYIDLGSDLPTLASGANEVTFSNTVTSLKIIPRWWIL